MNEAQAWAILLKSVRTPLNRWRASTVLSRQGDAAMALHAPLEQCFAPMRAIAVARLSDHGDGSVPGPRGTFITIVMMLE